MTNPGGAPVPQQPYTSEYYTATGGLEPEDTSPQAAVQSAGFTALFVAIATGIGLAAGKGWGATAGLTLSGAVANGYRAQKWMNEADPGRRHEAVVSATFALFEVAVGGYAVWKAVQEKKGS